MEELEISMDEQHEAIHEHAEKSGERWMLYSALIAALLAVAAAVSGLYSSHYANEAMLEQMSATDQWSYYQAKSVKQHLTEMELDLFKLELLKNDAAPLKAQIQGKMKSLEDNIARYDKEKAATKAEAEDISKAQGVLKRHGGNFGLSVMFFQIAIMLSAIGSLLKQRGAWICGLIIGVAGFVYFINGFLLLF